MLQILRSVVAVIAGLTVAVVCVFVLEMLGHQVFPPPPGIDLHDPEQLRAIVDKLPLGALVLVLVAWGVGSLAGGFVSALIAGRGHFPHALAIGGILLAFSALTMVMIPHPPWFMIAAVVALPAACSLGGWLAGRLHAAKISPAKSTVLN